MKAHEITVLVSLMFFVAACDNSEQASQLVSNSDANGQLPGEVLVAGLNELHAQTAQGEKEIDGRSFELLEKQQVTAKSDAANGFTDSWCISVSYIQRKTGKEEALWEDKIAVLGIKMSPNGPVVKSFSLSPGGGFNLEGIWNTCLASNARYLY